MTEMSMNKVIHGAFRRDLNRFIGALETFPTGDRTRSQQLDSAWSNFDDQLKHHHEGEHAIAWPALESVGVSKELLATMDAEHAAMAVALGETRSAMAALTRTSGSDEAKAALAAFETLQSVTVQHLQHEESELEPVYLANRETPEIKEMGRKFGKVSPARGGRFFAWLLDGASPDERATVKGEVPGPVLTILGFFGRGYNKNIAPIWK